MQQEPVHLEDVRLGRTKSRLPLGSIGRGSRGRDFNVGSQKKTYHFLKVSRALQQSTPLHEQDPVDGTCETEKTKVSTCTAHSFAVVIVKPF